MLVLVSDPLVCTYLMWKMEGVTIIGPRSSSLMLIGWFSLPVCHLVGDLLHLLDALDLDFLPYPEVCLVIAHLGLATNFSFLPHLTSSPHIHPLPLNLVVKSSGPLETIFEALCPQFVFFQTLHIWWH
jgi:hypothetical protein